MNPNRGPKCAQRGNPMRRAASSGDAARRHPMGWGGSMGRGEPMGGGDPTTSHGYCPDPTGRGDSMGGGPMALAAIAWTAAMPWAQACREGVDRLRRVPLGCQPHSEAVFGGLRRQLVGFGSALVESAPSTRALVCGCPWRGTRRGLCRRPGTASSSSWAPQGAATSSARRCCENWSPVWCGCRVWGLARATPHHTAGSKTQADAAQVRRRDPARPRMDVTGCSPVCA